MVIVLFDKIRWQHFSVDLAVPIGKRIPLRSLEWLKSFSERQRRPLIYSEQTEIGGIFQRQQQLFGHGPPAFQQEVERLLAANIPLW